MNSTQIKLQEKLEVLTEIRDRAKTFISEPHYSDEEWYKALYDAWDDIHAETELAIGIENRSGNNEP